MRRAALLLLLPFCVAAAPVDTPHPARKPVVQRLRPPAVPVAKPVAPAPAVVLRGDGFSPAPMPDPDLRAPVAFQDGRPQVAPTMFHLTSEHRGDGYVYGSSPQGMDDSRALTIPGMKLSVPLQ